jgi:hypothetical protein
MHRLPVPAAKHLMSTATAIADFWHLFATLSKQLADLTSADDPAYDQLLKQLHRVDPGLFLELATDPGHLELVVTADGNADLFELAEKVVQAAPPLDGWEFVALKPKMGFPETVSWEGVSINIEDVVFDPSTPEQSNELVLRLLVPGITEQEVDSAHNALLRALDQALGEREFAANVQYTEVEPLLEPADDYIPLLKLEEFLKWHNKKRGH